MSKSALIAARPVAKAIAADPHAPFVVVVSLLISGLVLILSSGADWLHTT